MEPGDFGALEYAAASAQTVRGALEVIVRYPRLVNDALSVSLEVDDRQAFLRLNSAIVLPRSSSDFQAAAFYVAMKLRPPIGPAPQIETWFTHARPEDTSEYDKTFPGETVRFGMAANGFMLDVATLDLPLQSADPKLHALIRRHAEILLAELPRAQSFTENVRVLLSRELAGGDPGVAHVATLLHMSTRTLGRRLADEGTTFTELVEDLRRRLALQYVGGRDLDISEVAFLLGFADSSSFYRAFKRWTGQTPLAYRRSRRR
jgi:AraC-like DNA-binding protein